MTTDATRRSRAFNRKRSTQQLVLRLGAWYIMFCGPQAQETKYWDLKHSKSVAAQAGHPWVHLYFCLQEKVAVFFHLPSLWAISHRGLKAECHSGGLGHTSERLLSLRAATVAP